MIYLDSAAMTPPLPCALEAYHAAPFGNPSSEHAAGQAARNALEQARGKIASLIDCDPDEVYFTSTATEAAALVMRSLNEAQHIVIDTQTEHHAVSENIDNDWAFDYNKRGTAICQMHSNNETGEITVYPEISERILLVCDATSSVGHVPLSFRSLGAGYLLADAIKFSGVPGAAFLITKKGTPLTPLIRGGGQERGMRSGTENLPAICAMAAALEWQCDHLERNTIHLNELFTAMLNSLLEIDGIQLNTPLNKPHLQHILNVSFPGVDAHTLALYLSNQGVMVSPGAACSNGLHEPSHVIMAMFNDEARARSAIRISMSHENTMEEISEAAQKIKEAVSYLRAIG